MLEPENIVEKIWTEFLVKVIQPNTPTDQLKYIAQVFHWGAMLMAREITENQNAFVIQINKDINKMIDEMEGVTKIENPN